MTSPSAIVSVIVAPKSPKKMKDVPKVIVESCPTPRAEATAEGAEATAEVAEATAEVAEAAADSTAAENGTDATMDTLLSGTEAWQSGE